MGINLKNISNPYSVLALSWCIGLILYSLGWSEVFPIISYKLSIFIVSLCILFFLVGCIFNIRFKNNWSNYSLNKQYHKSLLILDIILYVPNFFYSGIPLLSGERNLEFGIPTLIVICTTLNSFTSIYCYYLFLITGKKKFILYSVLCLCIFILVFSRGNIVMTGISMFFLWINLKQPKLNLRKVLIFLTATVLFMYLFGVAGNYRTINEVNSRVNNFDNSYNSNIILDVGEASDIFREKVLPGEFFWSYIYITSPLSNLQYNINKYSPSLTGSGMIQLFIDEVLFDTISKRLDIILNFKPKKPDLIVEALTVPTTFAESYIYAGWWGMIFLSFVLLLFPLLYVLCVANNPLGIIGISILCTSYFFSIFDNMLILTGLMSQIFFPIILFVINKIDFNKI
ncbi:MAG: oligosaccharide repeat unit polymerase [Rickettsiales bacterium]|nr:MAG: oligosaccharide repeat unit polymerase [Rickettsiales bacterium]